MNDENLDKAGDEPGPVRWVDIILSNVREFVGNALMLMYAIMIVGSFVCSFIYGPDELEGPHCAEAKGNVTCIEYFGGNQPYCEIESVTTINKGCSSERPPDEWAAPCGKMLGGLPGDPTCSKIVADNPPSAEVVAKRERAQLVERWIIPGIAIGSFLVITIWVYGRALLTVRARSSQVRRAQQLAAGDQPAAAADEAVQTVESNDPSA